jgi:hypothetical protein
MRSTRNSGSTSGGEQKQFQHAKLRAIAQRGHAVWNLWFERHPPMTTLDFRGFDFNQYPIDFSNFVFKAPPDSSACVNFTDVVLRDTSFNGATFETEAEFRKASFRDASSFENAVFFGAARFIDTHFTIEPCFGRAIFHENAIFSGAKFEKTTDFTETTFHNLADFSSARFAHQTDFSRSRFLGRAEFGKATFGMSPKFESVTFADVAIFKEAKFGLSCSFSRTTFGSHADFSSASFAKGTGFDNSSFHSHADFTGATLGDGTSFSAVAFGSPALFDTASFGNDADFRAATFHGAAEFRGAGFGDRPMFRKTRFVGDADFQAAAFGDDIDFECAEFSRSADFSASIRPDAEKTRLEFNAISFAGASFLGDATFEGRKFKSTTRFGRPRDVQDACAAIFRGIPNFHGCELHQDTDFRDTMFRDDFDAIQGPDAARAYRTLKLAMEKAKATREEQQFFRLEMRAEHPGMRFWPRTISSIYAAVSDYGFSLRRPVIALLGAAVLTGLIHGALANAEASKWQALLPSADFDPDRTLQWLRYVAINTLPVPGFDKTQMELRDALFGKDGAVVSIAMALEMLHKIVSLGCAFLLGLALRNLFKMKS